MLDCAHPVLAQNLSLVGGHVCCRGVCVDVFAPGVNILSAISTSDNSTGLKTGTSMAAPFATGVVAQYLETHPVSSHRCPKHQTLTAFNAPAAQAAC